MSIKKYSEYISLHEQKTRTIGLRSTSIDLEEASDKHYSIMGTTEFHSGGAGKERDRFENALDHAESKKYKINHDPGMGPEYVTNHRGGKPHKKPDVTVHMSYDDDTEEQDPIGYTVHHDGAAAKDKVMHIKHIMQNDSGKFIHKKKYNMNLGF